MKIFRHRNLMGCIFAIVMAVPLLSILCRSAYVVVNKNAYQSYSGSYATDTKEYINDYNDLVINENYYFTNPLLTYTPSSTTTIAIQVNNLVKTNDNTDLSNIHVLRFVFQSSGINTLQLRETQSGSNEYTYLVNSNILNFKFDYVNIIENPSNYYLLENCIYTIMYQGNTLDNAFDYSLSKFVDDNSFGNLNFFQWFESLFLDMSNSSNALYIHFVNWYMNYALFVSCAYILFLVLMWFINFSRRILERGMNYDW